MPGVRPDAAARATRPARPALTELRALLRVTIVITALAVVARGDGFYGAFCLLALLGLTAAGRWQRVPVALEVAVLTLMFLDMTVGNALGLYRQFTWFDKLLHLACSLLIGAVAFVAMAGLYQQRTRVPAWLVGLAAVLLTLGLGATWELAEYGVDVALARRTQSAPALAPHDDTMLDLAFNAAGSTLGVLLAWIATRRTMRA